MTGLPVYAASRKHPPCCKPFFGNLFAASLARAQKERARKKGWGRAVIALLGKRKRKRLQRPGPVVPRAEKKKKCAQSRSRDQPQRNPGTGLDRLAIGCKKRGRDSDAAGLRRHAAVVALIRQSGWRQAESEGGSEQKIRAAGSDSQRQMSKLQIKTEEDEGMMGMRWMRECKVTALGS
ncbi:hypothetical protein AOQ84DRAFT_405303 [Glonium stellatum]|uniref:Uncharacterized protein n=1 Tax=Glonium stellatum TaxID=574774 RepID=A0A8E2F279_9PEZI|nr:hypothetical protein AOQ84DRAFT_405303 [Glonium stellatum]